MEEKRQKRGPKPIEIDRKAFENLCGLQCTEIEIASFFGCSVATVERWCRKTYGRKFADVFREKREAGHISLRRAQWVLAEKSPAMAIFLGKNYLGQSDKLEVERPEDDALVAFLRRLDDGANADTEPETE